MRADDLNLYEQLIFTTAWGTLQKTAAALELYDAKNYPALAYFLALAGREELAKLIFLPLAREMDETTSLMVERRLDFLNPDLKEKICRSYGLSLQPKEEVDELMHFCIYVEERNGQPRYALIRQEQVYDLLKPLVDSFTRFIFKTVLLSKISINLKKDLMFLIKKFRAAVESCLPELDNEILRDADAILANLTSEQVFNDDKLFNEIFTNPYALVDIYKNIFGVEYKNEIKKLKIMPFDDMVKYLNDNIQKGGANA